MKTASRNTETASSCTRRHYFLLALAASLVFGLSVLFMPFLIERNDADWLAYTHRTEEDYRPLTLPERFFQFNTDQPSWVAITADFPRFYRTDPQRTSRPLYPALCTLPARALTLLQRWPDWRSALCEPMDLEVTFACMLFVNYFLVVGTILLFYAWCKRRLDEPTSLLAALWLVLCPFWLWQANQAATQVVAIAVVALVLYLFDDLWSRPAGSWGRLVLYSLAIGVAVLAKWQYDVLLACWIFSAWKRRYDVLAATFILQFAPLLFWILFLRMNGMEFHSHEVSGYGQGTWFMTLLASGQWRDLYWKLTELTGESLTALVQAFFPVALVLASVVLVRRDLAPPELRRFCWIGLGAVFAFLVAIARPRGYLAFDGFFAVLPAAALGLLHLERVCRPRLTARAARWFVPAFLLVNTALSWYLAIPPNCRWRPALSQMVELLTYRRP